MTKNNQVYLSGADATNEISELNTVDIFPQATGMTMDSHLSQNVFADDDDDTMLDTDETVFTCPTVNKTDRGSDLWNRTMEVFELIRTEGDEAEFRNFLIKFSNKKVAKKSMGKVRDTSIFGSQLTNFRKKRKRKLQKKNRKRTRRMTKNQKKILLKKRLQMKRKKKIQTKKKKKSNLLKSLKMKLTKFLLSLIA